MVHVALVIWPHWSPSVPQALAHVLECSSLPCLLPPPGMAISCSFFLSLAPVSPPRLALTPYGSVLFSMTHPFPYVNYHLLKLHHPFTHTLIHLPQWHVSFLRTRTGFVLLSTPQCSASHTEGSVSTSWMHGCPHLAQVCLMAQPSCLPGQSSCPKGVSVKLRRGATTRTGTLLPLPVT